jgi:hypothetical protein
MHLGLHLADVGFGHIRWPVMLHQECLQVCGFHPAELILPVPA